MLSEIALGTAAAAYLDARWLFTQDLQLIGSIFKMALASISARLSGKINFFWTIENLAKTQPNALALLYPRPSANNTFVLETYTYKQLYETIQRYARVLKEDHGVKMGDTVAFDCVNKSEFILVWYALWSLGAKPAFINYNLKDHSLVHCVKAAGAKLLIADDEIRNNVEPVQGELNGLGVKVVYLDEPFLNRIKTAKPYLSSPAERNPKDEMWSTGMLIYTSGTTGLPKAAVMSWQKCFIGGRSYAAANRYRSTDILYSAMPLYHSTAAVLGLLAIHSIGGAYAVGHKFSTTTFWTQVSLTRATGIQYVGETCRYLFNAPPHKDERNHSLRFAVGNGLRPDVWVKFKERFNIPHIGEFYGATEFPTAATNYQTGEFAVGAVANYGSLIQKFLKLTRFKIAAIDPEDPNEIWRDPKTGLGRVTKSGEPGEFLFRIPDPKNVQQTFQGYTNDKGATNSKILHDVFKKGDAWVRSGDLLRYDDAGLIYFVDRMGDTFRWKSENVSTNEVEEVITGSDSSISQVVVVGVKVPNHEGRAGFAVVMPNNTEKIPDVDQLAKSLIAKLPRYAVPVFLKFVNQIETTGNNKIQKKLYRNQQIPSTTETIYWLKDNKYVPLTADDWKFVESGRSRL